MRTAEVACRGRTAEVEVVGEGRPIVYVGTAVPMSWTRPSSEALAALGYRVVNFDYGSGHDDPEPRTALAQVEDVLAVMDAVGVGDGVVVGLSRGAITAYGLAARHPDRVTALVQAFPVAGWEDVLGQVGPEPDADEPDPMASMLTTIFSRGFLAERHEEALALVTTPPGSVTRVERCDEEPFVATDRVVCPLLVIEGGSDQVVTSDHPKRYLAEHPDAQHVVVADAEHGWVMEDPKGFARIVADFAASF